MVIWFAAYIPNCHSGGIATSMRELSRGLKNRGHSVTVYTKQSLGGSNYITFSLRLCLTYLCALIYKKPDWIIGRSTDALFCALIIKLFRLNTRTILYNHGWEENVFELEKRLPSESISNPTTWRGRLVRFPMLRAMLHLATRCVCGTKWEYDILKKKHPKVKNRLCYLPNGIHKKSVKKLDKKNNFQPNFIFVGNTTWKKNIVHAIEIFKIIKPELQMAKLTCVGTGLDNSQIMSLCHDTPHDVINITNSHHKQMEQFYRSNTYMIMTSRYEGGHSFALLEALSFGLVVFASDIPSNREILTHKKNGFLISGINPQIDASQILQTTQNKTDLIDASREAPRSIQKYNWEYQINALEEILCRQAK